MKKLFYAFTVLSIGFAAASCERDGLAGDGITDPRGDLSAVKFAASVETDDPTRAGDTYFETGDRIGVYALSYTAGNPQPLNQSGNHADNVEYAYAAGGFISETPILSNRTEKYDYIAYHPYVSAVADPGAFSFAVKTDQRLESDMKASDLICARAGEATGDVELRFYHKMNRVKLVLTVAEPVVSKESINVTLPGLMSAAEIDLDGFVITPREDSRANISVFCKTTLFPASEIEMEALIVPQTFTAGGNLVEVVIGNEMFAFAPEGDVVFSSGKIREIRLDLEAGTEIKAVIIPEMADYLPAGEAKMTIRKQGETETKEVLVNIIAEASGTKISLMENVDDGTYELISVSNSDDFWGLGVSSELNGGDNTVADTWNTSLMCFGAGTAENPYKISHRIQLGKMKTGIGSADGYNGKHFQQTNDVDMKLAAGDRWNGGIGAVTAPFGGVYDGGGFRVKNFYMYVPNNSRGSGFFNVIGGTESQRAVVRNLSVEGDIEMQNANGSRGTAAIVGIAFDYSDIVNCHNYAGYSLARGRWTAGVVGGVVENADVVTTTVDENSELIKNAKITSTVISGCTNHGNIPLSAGPAFNGTVVGLLHGTVERCANYGTIDNGTSNAGRIGALVGILHGYVSESFNAGTFNTSTANGTHFGGIVGVMWHDSSITDCYNSGTMNHPYSSNTTGGIVGNVPVNVEGWSIVNCYNVGKSNYTHTGAIFGQYATGSSQWPGIDKTAADYILGCYYTQSTGCIKGAGSPLVDDTVEVDGKPLIPALNNTEAMQQNSYEGWDFDNVWAIDEGSSTPYLKNNLPLTKPSVN